MFDFLFKHWDTLTAYVNPYHILLWGVLGGLAMLALVIVLQVVLRKKILVSRRYKILKVLSYCYMVFFPLWTGFYAAQWFALHSLERQAVKSVPVLLGASNKQFNVMMKAFVSETISERYLDMTGGQVINKSASFVNDMAVNIFSGLVPDSGKGETLLMAFLINTMSKSGVIKKLIIDYAESAVGSVLLMDKKLTKEVLDVTFKDMANEGLFDTILIKHVKNLLGGFKSNILFVFLLGMALPVIEIIIACRTEKKRLGMKETVEVAAL